VIVMRATDPLIWRGSPAGREYLKTSKRVITGARTGMYTRAHPPLGYLDRKDLVHGRLLALRIDLYHSKAEILKRVGEICDLYKNASSGNHAADRRTAKEKKSGSLWERKWKIWDTYVGQGKKDIRRTAELMFPGEFQAQRDKKEMEAEAREKMKDMMRQGEKSPKAMAWYDNRIYRGKAAKSRIEKRDRIVKSLRAIINFCRRAIEIHEGSPS
jgi:hypothetical protein